MNIEAMIHAAGLPSLTVGPTLPAVMGAGTTAGAHTLPCHSPVDGSAVIPLGIANGSQVADVVSAADSAFRAWRLIPAPRRGELVRRIGELARQRKAALADLITLEAGKIRQEALGEVQEMIDVCDFAVGLSRQLYGLTIASERPTHRMMEQWHPLGPVAVITAFNFPMAVWAWNAMIALVCGDPVIWKPSEQTPLCAMACQQLVDDAIAGFGNEAPPYLSQVVQGQRETGHALAADPRVPLVSATGSCAMGRNVAQTVAARLGRSLLELGGNNAMIVTPSANLDLALRAIVFAAVGTTGQRCTSLRRVIVHQSLEAALLERIENAYASLTIGNPYDDKVNLGPLVSETAWERMQNAMAAVRAEGGHRVCGGERLTQGMPGGCYITPALCRVPGNLAVVREETFAPLLYVMPYETLEQAISLHNDVPQGLSSAIFTEHLREAEAFLGPAGSDCGIANVNIGTSGAEIGGAFGGEKDTGGGRESGSDAWKNYMRRTTNTINYGSSLPLAQGIRFEL